MLLHHRFIEIAKKNAKKIAIYDQATGKDITYERMLLASLLLAKKFQKYKGHYLGIMVPTSAGCMLSILGALMSGKIPVMINYSTGARENSIYAQEKCSFKTIITSKKLLEKLNIEPVPGMIYLEDIMAGIKLTDKLGSLLKTKLPRGIIKSVVQGESEEDTSIILFTSGSEKEPKAVQLTHRNISHNINNIPNIIKILDSDIFAGTLPLFHVFGLTTNFWLPLLMGCSIVAHPNPLDYKAIVESIKKYGITVLIGTPTFFWGYLKKAQTGDLESIRYAIAGADKLTDKLRNTYIKEHHIEILEGYGATETSPVISVNRPDANKPGSIGKPIPGVKVKILDRETDEELPPGQEGKIVVKGDLVMKGYLGDIEETSLHIRNGWYDTGDMGVLDEDGFLWHRGRLKRFVKIAGEMVSLVKVEDVLSSLLPEKVICCVVDVPNPTKGSDIVAAVTTGEIDKKKIIRNMKKMLPPIAIPKEFYVIEDIPMMGSGKVSFREVEKICREFQENGNEKDKIH
ncbi:MAG: AMP-binding protein [Candidatus Cloacimonetes bacterium]|nr:AMP-binding protein [Candidatus Cloacimonadota bacterium]